MAGNKNPFIVLIIVLVLIGAFAGFTFMQYQQEKVKNQQLQDDIAAMAQKNKSMQAELEDAQNTITQLKSSLSDTQQRVTDLTTQLNTERDSKNASSAELTKLKDDLAQQNAAKADLEKKLADSVETMKALDARVKEMEAQLQGLESDKAALEAKVKDLTAKSNVELGKIVVSSSEAPAAAAAAVAGSGAAKTGLEGKILVVNKDYNFAVVNLGNRDGITAGSVFTVIHGSKPVAELKVEKVHDSMSAAGFTPDIKDKIAEGDKVVLKSS